MLGGQSSNTLTAASSYGPPTLSSFASVGSSDPNALLTGGGEAVLISGSNFGPASVSAGPLLAAYYSTQITNGPVSSVLYNSSCVVVVDNTQLQCSTIAGAAANLIWSVSVAGQASAQPTTSYEIPAITAVTDAYGATVSAAAVGGGTVLYISGSGFGPVDYDGYNVSLLQGVFFGATGSEVSAAPSTFRLINTSCITLSLPPGSGSGLFITVQVADQR